MFPALLDEEGRRFGPGNQGQRCHDGCHSRNLASLLLICSTYSEQHPQLQLIDGDIALRETAKRIVDAAVQNFGKVDLLVNNAGVFIAKPFTSYTAQDFEAAMQTNVFGFFHLSQLAMDQMRTQKAGHVVNITSSLTDQPIAGVPAALTNLTKGGLESVTRALAIEFASEGIRCNAISPGAVNTPMHPVEAHPFLKGLSPMQRMAEASEVADLLLYLERAAFVTGEVVHLDGGAHAGRW